MTEKLQKVLANQGLGRDEKWNVGLRKAEYRLTVP